MLVDRWLKTDETAEQILHTGREKPIRSIVKAASWRATGTVDTIILSWFFTGNIGTALSIGFTEVATKMLLYYVHERVWNRIPLGRERLPVDQTQTPNSVVDVINPEPQATTA